MFTQILLALVAVFLLYLGIVEQSLLNIIIASVLIVMSAGKFYQATSGSSFQEQFDKWRLKQQKNSDNK